MCIKKGRKSLESKAEQRPRNKKEDGEDVVWEAIG